MSNRSKDQDSHRRIDTSRGTNAANKTNKTRIHSYDTHKQTLSDAISKQENSAEYLTSSLDSQSNISQYQIGINEALRKQRELQTIREASEHREDT